MLTRIPAAATRRGSAKLFWRATAAAASLPRGNVLLLFQRRGLTPAPRPDSGPLLERRADRELPDVAAFRSKWWRTFPLFVAAMAVAALAIFNYEKYSSSVVASTLYALRTSARAREVLGDEIYFARAIPWVRGSNDLVHGRVDIRFRVRGTRGSATMRFVSSRPSPRAMFETSEWSLELADGTRVDLLEGEDQDAFQGFVTAAVAGGDVGPEEGSRGRRGVSRDEEDEDRLVPRGFRKSK